MFQQYVKAVQNMDCFNSNIQLEKKLSIKSCDSNWVIVCLAVTTLHHIQQAIHTTTLDDAPEETIYDSVTKRLTQKIQLLLPPTIILPQRKNVDIAEKPY